MTFERALRHVWPALVLASIIAATPLWTSSHLPPQDLPSHLAIMATLARNDEPGWHERFEDRRALWPYTAAYSAVLPVVRAIGAEATGRLLLSLYVVLLPLSLAAVLHGWRPGTEPAALLAIPLTYSDIYLMGFINFLFSLPLLFFAVALALAALRGGPRSTLAAVALCGCLLIACFTHPMSIALFALLSASWVAFCAVDVRRLIVFGVACAPAGGTFAWWLLEQSTETAWRIPALYKLTYLLTAPAFLLDAGGIGEADWVLAGIVALALAAGVSAIRARTAPWPRPAAVIARAAREGTCWVGFLAMLALYFGLPFARDATIWLDLRLATVVWMMLIVCTAGAVVRSRVAVVLGVAIVFVYLVGVHRVHRAYAAEASPLFELLGKLPDDARLLPILLDARSDAINPSHLRERVVKYSSPYTHFVSWYHLEKRGESPYMAFHHSMSYLPLALKSPFYRHRFAVGGAFAPERLLGQLPALAPKFDFIVVRAKNLQGLAAVEEVASLYASSPPFYAFAVRR